MKLLSGPGRYRAFARDVLADHALPVSLHGAWKHAREYCSISKEVLRQNLDELVELQEAEVEQYGRARIYQLTERGWQWHFWLHKRNSLPPPPLPQESRP